MEIKLLKKEIDQNQLFNDFIEDRIEGNEEYFSNETVFVKKLELFPIYIAKGDATEREKLFLEAFHIIETYYADLDREILLNGQFWRTLFLTHFRDELLTLYPQIKEEKEFNNVIMKKFDWENYVYKCILAVQYVGSNCNSEEEKLKRYKLIIDNLDLYNYIIKYEIFRNDVFLINVLDIIDEMNLSKQLKAKIKGIEGLGKDERYGRRVIYEFNKSYPIVMSPMMSKEDLKAQFIEYLSIYTDVSHLKEPVH